MAAIYKMAAKIYFHNSFNMVSHEKAKEYEYAKMDLLI